MAEQLTPGERFTRWLELAEEPERTEAQIEFRNLYRLPSMVYYFKMLCAHINHRNNLQGHNLSTSEGVQNAIRNQGVMEGLNLALECAIQLAIPADGDEDAAG